MKLRQIFAFEFNYQIRRATTWIYFGVLLIIAYLIVVANYASDARDGYFMVNAPIVIASVAVITSVKWLLIGASVAGDAAARDVQTRMHLLTYTAPASKAAYLGGRFLAALALSVIILLSIPIGILLGMHFSGLEPEILGPFRATAYLTTFFFIVLPNAFFATAIQFSLAALSRRAMSSYLAGAIMFATAYILGQALQNKGEWGNLVDAMAFTPVLRHLSNDWSPLEKSTRLFLLEGSFLANRLLWFGISLGLLAITYFRFQFVLPETSSRKKPGKVEKPTTAAGEKLTWNDRQILPQVRGMFSFGTQLHQLRLITRKSFLQIFNSKPGFPLLALLALMMGVALQGNLKGRGVPLLPRTDFVLHELTAPLTQPGPFYIMLALLLIYYAGELVWRERDTNLSQIANVVPVPEWVFFGSRFLALGLLLVVWLVLVMAAGIIYQLAVGGFYPEIGLYLKVLFGLQLVECLLFALLILLVHVLVNQKFVGHLVALLVYSFIVYGPKLGIEHKLLIFSSSPAWTYTNMAGFGASLSPWLWFKGYWGAWALLLGVVAMLSWVRSQEGSLVSRFKLASKRFTGSVATFSLVVLAGIIFFGGYIFYNTNILNEYLSSEKATERSADYEHRYRKYRNIAQPLLTAVKLQVEIYPKQRIAEIQGSYLLVNNKSVAIDSIHLATGSGVETSVIHFNQPFKSVHKDEVHGYHIYALKQSLQPGDSLRMSFKVKHQPKGFSNKDAAGQILENGTSFRNLEWLPVLGYQPYRELDQAGDRKAYGLAPRPATYSLYDVAARRYAPFPEQISLDAIVGTDADQTIVAPGTLRRSWIKGGRRYFHYATDAPIRNEYSFFSANYAVQEGKWKNPSADPVQEVAIQVYYPPGMTENPQRMIKSAQASLDYFSKQYGPCPHRQLRFVTHASYAFGHHAAPINITAEEGFFLLHPKADERNFDLVTAVVAHEVAHQWWGNQLKQAYVEGAGLITESLAWYSAMGVLEDNYGAKHLKALLNFLREENKTPRTKAAKPLLQSDDFYQNYRKGPFALYALSQYIGRDKVNGALRNLLANHRPGTVPHPTSLDLYRELKTATPDSLQLLLQDFFEANTFWEMGTKEATAKKLKGGNWEVTLTIEGNKLAIDSAGTETKIPMKDWVEIGVFGTAEPGKELGKLLYLQKQFIKSGKQTITVIVPQRPAKGGIDPRQLLIDWNIEDNNKVLKLEK